jgi:hypothetical protein
VLEQQNIFQPVRPKVNFELVDMLGTIEEINEERKLEEINNNLKKIKSDLHNQGGPSLSVRLLHAFNGGCHGFREKTIENRRLRGDPHPGEAMPQDIVALILMLIGFLLVWSGNFTAPSPSLSRFILGIILVVVAIIITRL